MAVPAVEPVAGSAAPSAGPPGRLVSRFASDDPDDDRPEGDPTTDLEEAAAVPVGHLRLGLGRRGGAGRARGRRPRRRGRAQHEPQRTEGCRDGEGHGDDREEGIGQGLPDSRDEADGARQQEAGDRDGPPPPASRPEQAGDGDRGGHDQDVERELVGLAEELDEELLAAGWLVGDHQVSDGDDEGRCPTDEPGHELTDRDAERRGQTAGDEGGYVSGARSRRPRRGCDGRVRGHVGVSKQTTMTARRRSSDIHGAAGGPVGHTRRP